MDEHDAAIDSAARMHGDTPNWSFNVQDYVHESLPKADLLVSRAALLVDPTTPLPRSCMCGKGRAVKSQCLLLLIKMLIALISGTACAPSLVDTAFKVQNF